MDAPTLVDVAGDETVESQALLHAGRREKMVSHQIRARGITDASVLAAMLRVPRRHFVADRDRDRAHADHPLPIGHGQTISQPYIVALMSELAALDPVIVSACAVPITEGGCNQSVKSLVTSG
ncbi:MAG TPA: hypothetical protein EYQ46_15475, partial [Myxococcales bacterium]|nr:hypothetical protein [Myxococcales bacterium]